MLYCARPPPSLQEQDECGNACGGHKNNYALQITVAIFRSCLLERRVAPWSGWRAQIKSDNFLKSHWKTISKQDYPYDQYKDIKYLTYIYKHNIYNLDQMILFSLVSFDNQAVKRNKKGGRFDLYIYICMIGLIDFYWCINLEVHSQTEPLIVVGFTQSSVPWPPWPNFFLFCAPLRTWMSLAKNVLSGDSKTLCRSQIPGDRPSGPGRKEKGKRMA